MDLPKCMLRCKGVNEDGHWREGCENCMRRLAIDEDKKDSEEMNEEVSYMEPPPILAFFCPWIIEKRMCRD